MHQCCVQRTSGAVADLAEGGGVLRGVRLAFEAALGAERGGAAEHARQVRVLGGAAAQQWPAGFLLFVSLLPCSGSGTLSQGTEIGLLSHLKQELTLSPRLVERASHRVQSETSHSVMSDGAGWTAG